MSAELKSLEEKLHRLEERFQKIERQLAEHVKEAVRGEDPPLEEAAPRATWALVWFAYPIGLILFALAGAAVATYYWTQ